MAIFTLLILAEVGSTSHSYTMLEMSKGFVILQRLRVSLEFSLLIIRKVPMGDLTLKTAIKREV